MRLPLSPAAVRQILIGQVRAVFNDQSRGEAPVQRSDDALLPRGSLAGRVHGDVTAMMVGGVAALLLQMLHPAAAAGVWDFSNFRTDTIGRLRRTARFIALTTFGDRTQAEAMIERVRGIHEKVHGFLPDGTPYSATDPRLLTWVHTAEMTCFLAAWMRYGDRTLSAADQDTYMAETAPVARRLGASAVPENWGAANAFIEAMRPELRVDARTREIAKIILSERPPGAMMGLVQGAIVQASLDILPDWARQMHGLKASAVARPFVQGTIFGVAHSLRWAFAGNAPKKSAPSGS